MSRKLLMFNNYVNILNPTEGFFSGVNTAYQTNKQKKNWKHDEMWVPIKLLSFL